MKTISPATNTAPADDVDPPAEQEEAPEEERVGAHDPLEALPRDPRSVSMDGRATSRSQCRDDHELHAEEQSECERLPSSHAIMVRPFVRQKRLANLHDALSKSNLHFREESWRYNRRVQALQPVLPMAHALSLVGERSSLLIVRSCCEARTVHRPGRGLPGIRTNILAGARKTSRRRGGREAKLPPPAASTVYELTEYGAGFQEALYALARWARARSARHEEGRPLQDWA